MLSFENDYSCTATPEIIERISEIAQNQYPGYGNDSICESAKAKIREACACPDAQIFFLVGGTQTNQTIIDSITPQYAGVIAASTGHVRRSARSARSTTCRCSSTAHDLATR